MTGLAVAAGLALGTLGTLPGRAHAAELDLGAVNRMDHAAITEALGGISEESPWVAGKA